MKNAFITGGAGFVGKSLIKDLLLKGYKITALDIAQRPADLPDKVDYIVGDLTDYENIKKSIHAHNAIDEKTIIFHCAALLTNSQGTMQQFLKINVDATMQLLEIAIERRAKKFLFMSSIAAAGAEGSLANPMDETTPAKPISFYGKSKLIAEKKILERAPENLSVIIIRASVSFGPGMNPKAGAASLFKACSRKVLPIIGNGKNFADFTYIDNLVNGIITCAENTEGKELYFLSNGQHYNLLEVINELKNQLGSNTKLLRFPYFIIYPFAWLTEKFGNLINRGLLFNTELVKGVATNQMVYSIEKAKKIGYDPQITFFEGIAKTMEYLQSVDE